MVEIVLYRMTMAKQNVKETDEFRHMKKFLRTNAIPATFHHMQRLAS
jgi:hypothetical protein